MIIITHHLYTVVDGWTPWIGGWIYCEFFFIITGFYTAKHFYGKKDSDRPRAALMYIVRKFKSYLPYTTIAILAVYIMGGIQMMGYGIKTAIFYFTDMPFEMLYIRAVRLGPMWFLSALFLAFPFFSLFIQMKNRYLVCMGSIMYSVWYYYSTNDLHSETSWQRAMAGLMIGTFIFYADTILQEECMELSGAINSHSVMLSVIEVICLMLPVVYSFFTDPEFHTVILCFVIGLWILLTGKSSTSRIEIPVAVYLGKVAMPLYVFHMVISELIKMMHFPEKRGVKIVVYYVASLTLACVTDYLYHKKSGGNDRICGVIRR